jgi:hypothetical protein
MTPRSRPASHLWRLLATRGPAPAGIARVSRSQALLNHGCERWPTVLQRNFSHSASFNDRSRHAHCRGHAQQSAARFQDGQSFAQRHLIRSRRSCGWETPRMRCAHLISVAAQEFLTQPADESCCDTVAHQSVAQLQRIDHSHVRTPWIPARDTMFCDVIS